MFPWLERLRIKSTRDGSTKYLSRFKKYLRCYDIDMYIINSCYQYIYIYIYIYMIKRKLFSILSNIQIQLVPNSLSNNGPTWRGQVVNPRPKTSQGQPVTELERKDKTEMFNQSGFHFNVRLKKYEYISRISVFCSSLLFRTGSMIRLPQCHINTS